MCAHASVSLPAEPRSAGDAREFIGKCCRRWNLDSICDDVTLPVSELVTNALVHARTTVAVDVTLRAASVEVAVSDRNPRRPVMRPARADVLADIDLVAARTTHLPDDLRHDSLHVGDAGAITAGRGLHIVDAVADEWGVSELTTGKAVWFRIGAPVGWTPPQPCLCSASNSASGRSTAR